MRHGYQANDKMAFQNYFVLLDNDNNDKIFF